MASNSGGCGQEDPPQSKEPGSSIETPKIIKNPDRFATCQNGSRQTSITDFLKPLKTSKVNQIGVVGSRVHMEPSSKAGKAKITVVEGQKKSVLPKNIGNVKKVCLKTQTKWPSAVVIEASRGFFTLQQVVPGQAVP